MDSSRLPGKVLMKLQDKTILEHIVDFLKYSKLTDKIIVATSNLHQDDQIEELLNTINIECYRGSSNDVLARYYECAKIFMGDIIVRITADDPLINPELIDEVIQVCQKTGCDYATNLLTKTYPYGIFGEAFTFSILEQLHKSRNDQMSREHVTYHMTENPYLYKIEEVFAIPELSRPNWRLTVDYIEDYYLMQEIFARLYRPNSYIKYETLVKLLDDNPDLLKINEKYY